MFRLNIKKHFFFQEKIVFITSKFRAIFELTSVNSSGIVISEFIKMKVSENKNISLTMKYNVFIINLLKHIFNEGTMT